MVPGNSGTERPRSAGIPLRPVVVHTAAEDAALQLSALVKDGHLQPGDPLPSEAELAQALCVARSTVREAKRTLVAQGIIELRGKRGTFVSARAFEASAVRRALDMLATGVVKDLYETRRVVEIAAAGLAAERHTEADLEHLATVLSQLENEWQERNSWSAGLAFHVAIVEMTHNQVLVAVYGLIAQFMQGHHVPYYRAIADGASEIRSHEVLLEAIRGGDPRVAADAMRQHLDGVEAVRQQAASPEGG